LGFLNKLIAVLSFHLLPVLSEFGSLTFPSLWESAIGLRQAKGLILGPSAKRTNDLLKLNRLQLRLEVGLFTGHCGLKGHLFKLGLADDPTCERCLEEHGSGTDVLYDCEAIVYLRFRNLGQYFLEPSDYYDVRINTVLHFIPSVGLIKS
jgi:hypothetical protein